MVTVDLDSRGEMVQGKYIGRWDFTLLIPFIVVNLLVLRPSLAVCHVLLFVIRPFFLFLFPQQPRRKHDKVSETAALV